MIAEIQMHVKACDFLVFPDSSPQEKRDMLETSYPMIVKFTGDVKRCWQDGGYLYELKPELS
jgi:hypothetical protein